MEKVNYQKITDGIIAELDLRASRPSLLLHACCAPCSSYVLEYLAEHFDIGVFFFNPNIFPRAEYDKRLGEMYKLLRLSGAEDKIRLIEGEYDTGAYAHCVKGFENEPEGGARCTQCFTLRLSETAKLAAAQGYEYFATTLTVSPHKNAALINGIGSVLSERYGVKYLLSDFKKRNGCKRTTELCEEYGIYRQSYCGCSFALESTR